MALVGVAAFAWAQGWQVTESQTIAPSVFFQAFRSEMPPLWVGVVRLPLPLPKELSLTPALGGDNGLGRQPLSQIAQRVQAQKGYVAAAINADYFSMTATNYSGDPLGIHIQDGELVSLPTFNRSALIGLRDGRVLIARFQANALVQLPDGRTMPLSGLNEPPPKNGWSLFTPAFGLTTQTPAGTVEIVAQANLPLRPNTPLTATVRAISTTGNAVIPRDGIVLVATGDAAAIAQTLTPDANLQLLINLTPLDASFDPRDIVWAIGGGPRLVRNGQVSVEYAAENFSAKFAETKHPRTAVGLKSDALLFVVVDGRQPGYSEGMTLFELAEFLRNAGCTDALNMDGGGSTTLWVRGAVVNRPSDGRERPIANALLLLNLFPPQPLVRLWVKAPEGHFLAGTLVPLTLFGEDAAYRLLPMKPEAVTATATPLAEIRWDGNALFLPTLNGDRPQRWQVTFTPKEWDAAFATASFCVHPKPDELQVTPNALLVAPGGSVRLTIRAFGREPSGEKVPLQFDARAVRWTVQGNIGSVQDGVFWAASQPSEGVLEATLNGVSVRIPVRVSNAAETGWQTLHELDDLSGIQVQMMPPTVRAEVAVTTANKRSGTGALQIRYDFSQGKRLRAVYLALNKPLPSGAKQLAIWVYGDGNECWLRARLRDGTGKLIFMDIVPVINWRNEWREVKVPLPSGLAEPIALEAIYLAAIRDDHQPQGVILLDSLRVGF
jgi:hypothetical protein